MELQEVIDQRRSSRALGPVEITESLIRDLAENAKKAPSCYNKQPWRFVFAYEKEVLNQLFQAMVKGNAWAHDASLVVAVFSEPSLDCQNNELDYYLFDSGMASAILILKATELGLVAHPIAGFDFPKAKKILNIPDEMTLITLIVIGKKMADESEEPTPRKEFSEFAFLNSFTG